MSPRLHMKNQTQRSHLLKVVWLARKRLELKPFVDTAHMTDHFSVRPCVALSRSVPYSGLNFPAFTVGVLSFSQA